MIDLATVAAIVAVAAAALAVGLRDVRASAVGAWPSPCSRPRSRPRRCPAPLPLAARFAGALLGADLLLGDRPRQGDRRTGHGRRFRRGRSRPWPRSSAGLWIAPVAPLARRRARDRAGRRARPDRSRAGAAHRPRPAADRESGDAAVRSGWPCCARPGSGPRPRSRTSAMAVLLAAILGAAGLMAAPDPRPSPRPLCGDDRPRRAPAPGRPRPAARSPWRPVPAGRRACPTPGEPGWAAGAAPGGRAAARPEAGPRQPPPRYAGAPADLRRKRNPRERGERE